MSSVGDGGEEYNRVRGISPTPGCSVLRAAMTYVQKRMGALSPSSSETQARGQAPGLASACQALSKVVLPQPAGATMRVSVPLSAVVIRCVSRGRITIFRRAGGTEIFVVSRWRAGKLAEESGAAAGG